MPFLINLLLSNQLITISIGNYVTKKHLSILTFSSVLTIPAVSHAESKDGFADIGIHYLNWTSKTIEKSSTKSYGDDFRYLELEGDTNFSWGEMYGLFDQENFYNDHHGKPGSKQRYTFKNTSHTYLGDAESNLYLHAYGTYGSANCVDLHDDIFLYGTGYDSIDNGWWFKPFFARRHADQTYYIDDSGYVADWTAGYSLMLDSEKFTLTNWSEYEFDRDTTYAAGNGGKEGLSGAVTFWWNATSHITTRIQHHYVDDKPDENFYQDMTIYSVEPNF